MTVDDILYIITGIFVFTLITFVAATAFYEIDTNVSITEALGADGAKYIDKGVTTIGTFDYLIVLTFFLYILATLILAFLAPTNPVFFILSFIFVSIQLVVVTWFENMFKFIFQTAIFQNIIGNYPLTFALFDNITVIIWIYSAILLIVMFGGVGKIAGSKGR